MVQLAERDIQTKEVLQWKGVHLLHFSGSSCSQKTRIFLNLKGIDWQSHPVNLGAKQHLTPWFMGINPRGLVPVLIDDGKVIIESNDILQYLEEKFPAPPLIPKGREEEVRQLLKFEDDMHLDLRALSMRYVVPGFLSVRKEKDLKKYEDFGSGSVNGQPDAHKQVELNFWRDMAASKGISDEQVRRSGNKFRAAFDRFEQQLGTNPYLLGDAVSLVDIAWFIYAARMDAADYPLKRLHPKLHAWYKKLSAREEFSKEVQPFPFPLNAIPPVLHLVQNLSGNSMSAVAGF